MSEGAGPEAVASRSNATAAAASSSVGRGATPADQWAAEEVIDETLAEDDRPLAHRKRKYPEPGFPIERSEARGGRGSYTVGFKLNAAAFTRVLCPDGKPVGNAGAAKVLGVDRRRIVAWVNEEENIKCKIKSKPSLSKAKSLHAGLRPSTADIDQELEDYINERRRNHRDCGSREVMHKLLELKPDVFGGLAATATRDEVTEFNGKFASWYTRFRKRRGLSVRRHTNAARELSEGHEGDTGGKSLDLITAAAKRLEAKSVSPGGGREGGSEAHPS